MNDALPIVDLSTKIKDKKVFGVISDREDDNQKTRQYNIGVFVSEYEKSIHDTRLIINGLGEGSIWVSNYNGNFENGDYITTSAIPGIGMKQDDDILHNYTVAKITMNCDFQPKLRHVMICKNNDKNEYDYYYDKNKNIIYDYEYDIKYVMLDGQIITKEEYNYNQSKGIECYIMALCGCTYHCS
jgi:hypothetical protein